MTMTALQTSPLPFRTVALAVSVFCLNLTACGGGGHNEAADPASPPIATDTAPSAVAPMFMRQAAAVAEPSDDVATDSNAPLAAASASANDAEMTFVSGRDEAAGPSVPLDQADGQGNPGTAASDLPGTLGAAATNYAVFTPATIRAAYGLPVLPTSFNNLSATQAAALGAGQTIYIVDAFHYPNAERDLAAFSAKFGLPSCQTVAIGTSTALPLPSAPTDKCTLSIVPVMANAKGTPVVDSKFANYNSGWAQEAALDVQWAHAIAPLARIVLLESRTNGVGEMSNAINMAARMGPGAVSMSFAANEGSWGSYYDTPFRAPGLSYLAATGDWGAKAMWPSVSATVLAIGGTRLGYSGVGARTETAWSLTGGAVSAYTLMPSYQSATALPAQSVYRAATKSYVKMRGVADVAFNADPYSAQYVAFSAPGAPAVSWYAYGGTSISTPQWAGLVAIANAQRALKGKAPLGQNLHQALYDIAGNAANYRLAFNDVMTGANGSCTACRAGTGFDIPTGLGTPNASALLTLLQNR
jgi:subtilase family serine protease